MYKWILVIFMLLNNTISFKIQNFFRKKICYSKILIKKNNIYSNKEILQKNDDFYIYISGKKSFKAKIIKDYKDINNLEINDDNLEINKENKNEIKNKNKIINITQNVLSFFLFLFLYFSMNSYMLGVQLRKKINNNIN